MQSYQYETTYIVSGSLEDSQIESTVAHVDELIRRNGGEIQATNRWGRKRLAYPIDKKNNGFYINLEFTSPGALIAQLERLYQLDENILRFLTIRLDKRALKARALGAVRLAEQETASAAESQAGSPVADGGTGPAVISGSGPAAAPAGPEADRPAGRDRKPIFNEAEGE